MRSDKAMLMRGAVYACRAAAMRRRVARRRQLMVFDYAMFRHAMVFTRCFTLISRAALPRALLRLLSFAAYVIADS
jgi:hypothetical protein